MRKSGYSFRDTVTPQNGKSSCSLRHVVSLISKVPDALHALTGTRPIVRSQSFSRPTGRSAHPSTTERPGRQHKRLESVDENSSNWGRAPSNQRRRDSMSPAPQDSTVDLHRSPSEPVLYGQSFAKQKHTSSDVVSGQAAGKIPSRPSREGVEQLFQQTRTIGLHETSTRSSSRSRGRNLSPFSDTSTRSARTDASPVSSVSNYSATSEESQSSVAVGQAEEIMIGHRVTVMADFLNAPTPAPPVPKMPKRQDTQRSHTRQQSSVSSVSTVDMNKDLPAISPEKVKKERLPRVESEHFFASLNPPPPPPAAAPEKAPKKRLPRVESEHFFAFLNPAPTLAGAVPKVPAIDNTKAVADAAKVAMVSEVS